MSRAINHSVRADNPVVATIGFFDGVHLGHRHLLSCVAEYAHTHGATSAAITFPVHPRKVLQQEYQPQTLTPFYKKIELLNVTGIDQTVVIDFTPQIAALTAQEFLQMLAAEYRVKSLFMGYDHRFGSDRLTHFDQYLQRGKQTGIEILRADAFVLQHQQISSSYIRKLLGEGSITQATTALGRPYRLCGTVIHGFGIGGSQLGFHTANLHLEQPDQLIPHLGVYAVQTWIEGECHNGMANIGLRPTVHQAGEISIEIHLFDLNADLYGKRLCVDLIDFLRPEKKFANQEELRQQLVLDKERAQNRIKR